MPFSEPEGRDPSPALRRAILTYSSGRQTGRSHDLSQPTTTIGRVCDNLVALTDDSEVSRRHAEIRAEADGHVLYDLRSSNGTYVNGQRVGRHILQSGDKIRIGRTLFTFQIDLVRPAPVEEPVVAAPPVSVPEVTVAAPASPAAEVPAPDVSSQLPVMERPGPGGEEPTGPAELPPPVESASPDSAEDAAGVVVSAEPAAVPTSLEEMAPSVAAPATDVGPAESRAEEAIPVVQRRSQLPEGETAPPLQPAQAKTAPVAEIADREDETGRLLKEAAQMEESGRFTEALTAYRDLVARLPHESPLWREVNLIAGNLEARLTAPRVETRGESQPADATTGGRGSEGEVAVLMARAERLEGAGDVAEAAALYREASSHLPGDSSLRQELVAVTDALEARGAGRDEATELAARAQRLEAQGDMPGALAAYRQALAEVPVGSALHGELDSIVRDLERSTGQRLEAQDGELRRAESLEKAGRWTEAAAIYRERLVEATDPAWRARWQVGLARCEELVQLTKLYGESLEACRRGDWAVAQAGLQEIVRRQPGYQQDGYAAATLLDELQSRLTPAARSRVPAWWSAVGGVAMLVLLAIVAGGAYLITSRVEAGRSAATATAAAAMRSVQPVALAATAGPTTTATETPMPTATPTLAPVKPYPPHGFPLYSEDFANPDSGWDRVTDESADRDYQNGEYVILVKRSAWPLQAPGPKEVVADFTFEADVRLALGGSPGTRFGLTFRRRDQNNYYGFLITGDGRYGVWKIEAGRRSSLLDTEWTLTPHVQTGGASNHLGVVCFGTRMSFYANGQYLVTVDDSTFEAGRVGFIVETDTDGSPPRVAFDNAHLLVAYVAVPPVQPLSPHEVLEVSDDFGNPDSGWEQTQSDTQIKGYVNGRYAMVVKQAGLPAPCWALGPDISLSDFTLAVGARLVEGADGTRYGVMFWYADSDNYHVFYVSGDGRYGVTRVRDGKTSQIMAQELPLVGKPPRAVHELGMVCSGTRASLYVDSGYMGTVGFEAAGQGRIGLYVGPAEGAGPVTVTFDNLRLLAPASAATQQSRPTVTDQAPAPTAVPGAPAPAATPTRSHETKSVVLDRIAFVSNRDGNEEIYTMSPDGTGLIRLTNHPATDRYPAWSPDGARIAFTSERDGNPDIYVMDNDGSDVTRLIDHPANEAHPNWSPDGTRIVFDSDRDSMMSDLFVMNADGSGLVKLQEWGRVAAWSPDGSQIAANFQFESFAQLGLMPADGSGGPRPLLEVHMNNFPDWSPDGSRIAFESAIDADNVEIMVINRDGSNLVDLTKAPSFIDLHPSWSPDGRQIAFVSNRDGNDEIYLMGTDGSGLSRLTNNPAWDDMPTWSP